MDDPDVNDHPLKRVACPRPKAGLQGRLTTPHGSVEPYSDCEC